MRSLDEVIKEMCGFDYITSFCTACYRSGRTGEDFMCIAKPGLIQEYCIPNAILTFKEYLLDYASEETRRLGENVIKKELDMLEKENPARRKLVEDKLKLIEEGQRDVYV